MNQVKSHEKVMQCRAHNREECSECMKSVQKCHALFNADVTTECGCKSPVIADACQSYKERMPVCIGTVSYTHLTLPTNREV